MVDSISIRVLKRLLCSILDSQYISNIQMECVYSEFIMKHGKSEYTELGYYSPSMLARAESYSHT